jgi:hypothetical protein
MTNHLTCSLVVKQQGHQFNYGEQMADKWFHVEFQNHIKTQTLLVINLMHSDCTM